MWRYPQCPRVPLDILLTKAYPGNNFQSLVPRPLPSRGTTSSERGADSRPVRTALFGGAVLLTSSEVSSQSPHTATDTHFALKCHAVAGTH